MTFGVNMVPRRDWLVCSASQANLFYLKLSTKELEDWVPNDSTTIEMIYSDAAWNTNKKIEFEGRSV